MFFYLFLLFLVGRRRLLVGLGALAEAGAVRLRLVQQRDVVRGGGLEKVPHLLPGRAAIWGGRQGRREGAGWGGAEPGSGSSGSGSGSGSPGLGHRRGAAHSSPPGVPGVRAAPTPGPESPVLASRRPRLLSSSALLQARSRGCLRGCCRPWRRPSDGSRPHTTPPPRSGGGGRNEAGSARACVLRACVIASPRQKSKEQQNHKNS